MRSRKSCDELAATTTARRFDVRTDPEPARRRASVPHAGAGESRVASKLCGRLDQPWQPPHTIRYSVGDNRIDIELDDGGKSSLWWATRNEWLGLLDVAGLELEALYGGLAGEPFTDESREYVFVARR